MSDNKFLQIEKGLSQSFWSSDLVCVVLCIIAMAAVMVLIDMMGI